MAQNSRAWLTGDTLSSNTGRVLIIPGDLSFLMAVNGALLPLTYEQNWEQFGSVTPADAAYAMRLMYFDYLASEYEPVKGDSQLLLFGSTADVKVGAAMAMTIQTTQRFNSYWSQGAGTSTDRFGFKAMLAAGSWAYRVTYQRNTAAAILRLTVAAPTLALNVNLDLYGSSADNQALTGTFTIATGGAATIGCEVNGRNAANTTGYNIRLNCIELYQV